MSQYIWNKCRKREELREEFSGTSSVSVAHVTLPDLPPAADQVWLLWGSSSSCILVLSIDLLAEKKKSQLEEKWFVFWDLKILHLTVNNGDGDRKAGKGNKAETTMQNSKMRRMSESVQTGSNSGYTECKESAACDGGEVFLVVYFSIFLPSCLLFYGRKTFFFLFTFPPFKLIAIHNQKKKLKKTNMNYFFCKGLLCQQESARWLKGRAWWEAIVKENKHGRRRHSQSRTRWNKGLNRANTFTFFHLQNNKSHVVPSRNRCMKTKTLHAFGIIPPTRHLWIDNWSVTELQVSGSRRWRRRRGCSSGWISSLHTTVH